MPDTPQITFGDNVRVRQTPETASSGLAGLVGQVYGWTTPSVTGVKVIGELRRDHAVSVNFKERGETVWLADQLIEFVDHAPGTTVGAAGNQWVRNATGAWTPAAQEAPSSAERENRRVKIIVGAVVAIFIIIILFYFIQYH